jgi:hypothetical protein
MTIDRMHQEFKLLYDKMDSSAAPNILVPEIDFWLMEGYDRVIKTRYNRNNIYRKGFEEMQKRTDDLKQLVKTRFALVSPVTTEDNTYRVDLQSLYTDEGMTVPSTDRYMFYIRGRARHVKSGCTSTYFHVRIEQQDDIEKVKKDPFRKPSTIEAVGYFEDGDLFIITDGSYSIDRFKVTYIKVPAKIDKAQILSPVGLVGSSTIEVDEHLHNEIVKEAVYAALENVEAQRQATFPNQLNKEE